MTEQRQGVIAALAAFIFWGLMPIFFKAIQAVPALEIIAYRVLWAIPVLLLFLWFRDGRALPGKLRLPKKRIAGLALSGSLVGFNWLVFVWAVSNDQVLATSLGYFITPLVNVVLGVVFLSEKLSRPQTVAVLIAAAGTAYLAWYLGQPPWVSLLLAVSFGFYGLVRKSLGVGPMVGLLWEAGLLSLPAAVYLAWLGTRTDLHFTALGTTVTALLIASGLVTILPLIWYNIAAQHLKLSVVGFFQYLAPTISFLLAVFLFGETFTHGHLVAFSCIWLALVLISVEPWYRARRYRLPG